MCTCVISRLQIRVPLMRIFNLHWPCKVLLQLGTADRSRWPAKVPRLDSRSIFPQVNSHITTLHQASGNSSTLQKKKMSQLAALIDNSPHYPAQLTLKRQVVTKVDLHQVFRALRTAFGVIHDGLLSDCKTDHGRILWPIPESRWDSELLEQDLLENIFGRPSSHCNCRTAALDPRPRDEVTDCEVVGVVWV